MRIVDLSVPLKVGIASDPPMMLPSIEYYDHKQGAREFQMLFPGLKPEQLPDGEGPAIERVTISTHNGTHLDAPWHYASTMDGGKPSLKVDQLPLEWSFSAGVKLDFRDKPDGYVCKADDIKRELDRIGYMLKPLDIVLVNTAAGAAYGEPNFTDKGCGMGREATLYLTKQGVRSPAPTAGSGTRRSRSPASGLPRPATPVLFGKAIRQAARAAIVTWRSSPISISCRRSVSKCAASPSRSKRPPPAGPAAWRCSTTS